MSTPSPIKRRALASLDANTASPSIQSRIGKDLQRADAPLRPFREEVSSIAPSRDNASKKRVSAAPQDGQPAKKTCLVPEGYQQASAMANASEVRAPLSHEALLPNTYTETCAWTRNPKLNGNTRHHQHHHPSSTPRASTSPKPPISQNPIWLSRSKAQLQPQCR